MAETTEELAQQEHVKAALAQTTEKPPPKAEVRDKFWFATHLFLLLGCGVFSYLLSLKMIPLGDATLQLLQRLTRGAMLIVILLALAKCVDV